MSGRHESEGTLRAFADGELDAVARLRCALHLRRCAACRRALVEERRLGDATSRVLATLRGGVDRADGWARLRTLRPAVARGRWRLPAVVGFAVVLTAAALALPRLRASRADGPELLGRRDVCCWDLDGGGPGDDGVLTLTLAGERLACVVLYDDVDGSRTLSSGDVIRYVSSRGACHLDGEPLPARADRSLLLAFGAARPDPLSPLAAR